VSTARTFLSWHRAGLASAVTGAPLTGSRAQLPASISLDAGHVSGIPVDLLGPGDVTGLDPAEVVRCEPADATATFPPSELPYVELRHADLPWRFTPVGSAGAELTDPESTTGAAVPQSRLQPWIALVVVRADHATLTRDVDGHSTLTCAASDLPDLAEAWAWAHVQIAGDPADDPDAVLGPGRAFARLVCPIRLQADQAYVAGIAPTYAAGLAAAGIPLPDNASPLGPAWSGTDEVTVPLYHDWSFTTGDAGSFETLARRLRPRPAPASANGRRLRIDAAGWGATAAAGSTVLVQGALRPLAGVAADPPADAPFAASLAAALSSAGGMTELRPPLYGQDHVSSATSVAAGARGWFSELNTDARRRFAAGLGAWAVAVDQENLCDRAWQQLADSAVSATAATSDDMASAVLGALADRHPIAVNAAVATMAATGATGTALAGGAGTVTTRMLRPGGSLARLGFGATSPLRPTALVRAAVAPNTPAPTTFCPTFDDTGLQALLSGAPEWLLPGMQDLPDDSVVLMRTNPAFVEAFLVGLNHAMARELQWRRYPLDPSGTMFASFWPAVNGEVTAMPAMATWDPASDLGSHQSGAGNVVMVIRGALLRRFPTATVYLSGRMEAGPKTGVLPTIEAYAGSDTTLVGFPMSADQLLHPSTPGQVWSVVLQESVLHTRFGLDDAPADGTTAALTTWQDLDWGNPQVSGATHVRVAGPPLAGVGRPTGVSLDGAPSVVHWAADSSSMAAALTRAPVRVRIPASLWLTPTDA
jgi:hypothetical protein